PSTAAPTPAPTLAPSPAPSPTPPPTEPPSAQPSVVVVAPTPAPPSATPTATASPLPQPSAPPAPSAVAILAPGIRADPPAIYRGQSVAFLLTSFSPGLVVDITVTDPDGFVRQTIGATIGPNGSPLALPYYATKPADPSGVYRASIEKGGLLLSVGFLVYP
ncbi:MAG: hypothetical protein KGQ88_00005, partial [Chloroflexi bacterium]|nr:hypothetical protein [Chloroflexota bacterium]